MKHLPNGFTLCALLAGSPSCAQGVSQEHAPVGTGSSPSVAALSGGADGQYVQSSGGQNNTDAIAAGGQQNHSGGSGGAFAPSSGGVASNGGQASGGAFETFSGGVGSGGVGTGSGGQAPDDKNVVIEDVAYVFSSFTDNGEDGLHLIASYDGLEWTEVDRYRSVFKQDSELMRDPSVVYGPDGLFHMVWTTGWWEQNIAIAHSSDLINWQEEHLYVWADYTGPGTEESDGSHWPTDTLNTPAPSNAYVRNSWAPEIFYDGSTGEYVIYWSSTIDSPEVFPNTWNERDDGLNHRIYFITTRDFKSYTKRRLLYQPPDRLVIDAFICKLGRDDYRMIIKDEANSGYGNLHIVSSTQPLSSWSELPVDFWGDLSASPFAGEKIGPDFSKAEGPGGILMNGEWYIYADYWTDGKTRAWKANDFLDIKPINTLQFPFHLRHGTIFQAPREIVENLLDR